jgi:dTDP-4-amino-4,6-dideoxygalactose transaminase
MSRVSEFILAYSRIDRIYDGRRTNYLRILEALAGIPGIKPLFFELPEGTVPMVVPMVVQDPNVVFPMLKNAGVPIWRFGEYLYPQINEDLCKNSIFLSRHVFQFPCHPDLTDKEIDWMVDTIKLRLSQ